MQETTDLEQLDVPHPVHPDRPLERDKRSEERHRDRSGRVLEAEVGDLSGHVTPTETYQLSLPFQLLLPSYPTLISTHQTGKHDPRSPQRRCRRTQREKRVDTLLIGTEGVLDRRLLGERAGDVVRRPF